MPKTTRLAPLVAVAATLATQHAFAHAVAGARIFVNTNLIDDPGVSDEANLPLISLQSPDGKSWVTDANVEYDKTITPALGFGVGTDYDWIANDQTDFKKSHGGFDDPYVQLKYRWFLSPEHEFISSVAVTQSFGRAGTTNINSGFDTTTVSGYFGKGFGDIPFDPIRPFAITGELDYNVPNTGPSRGGSITTWSGGLTLQYLDSLSAIADQGLRVAEHPGQPDAAGRTRLDLGRRQLQHAADRQPHHLPAWNRRGVDRSLLCDLCRSALATQWRGRAQHWRDRTVPPLFRRPDAEHARQTDLAMVTAMRWTHWLLPAMLCMASPAFAHAFLQRASPPVGSELPVSPSAVTITYTEGVEPDFSTIEVHNAQGARVDKADPHLLGGDQTKLSVSLPKLPPGQYTVTWHVTSVDTHKTEGRFNFSVTP